MVSLLALSFHPAFYPPKSGGELRLYNIYNQLSKRFDVRLVTFTYPNNENKIEIVNHNDRFKEIRIPKTKISIMLHYLVKRFSNIQECSAVITSIESRFNKNFKSMMKEEVNKADIVNFVYPYLYTIPAKILKNKKVVYESHNVEYELMRQSLSGSIIGRILLQYIHHLEGSLAKRSDLIFAVSRENRDLLSILYKVAGNKIELSPNGVNFGEYDDFIKRIKPKHAANCVFVGSYHPPNIEAIENITKIAAHLPHVNFSIAGNAAQYYINQASDLLEQEDIKSIPPGRDVLIRGFYGTELWGSTTTAWSKPTFKILVSDGIVALELRFFSPSSQQIKVDSLGKTEHFDLVKGHNSISVSIIESKMQTLFFRCEKSISDHKRDLGIALQELIYKKGGKDFSLNLSKGIQSHFVFKETKNVLLLGQVGDDEKLELYRISDIALNPMMSGSGTNIKILDYMAAGLPVVTTSIGARGLDLENYCQAIICDLLEFPEKVMEIMNDSELYFWLRDHGRRLVEEKYDWSKIAGNMAEILERALK